MGGILSFKYSQQLPKIKRERIYSPEVMQLRQMIHEKSQFPYVENIVLILYGPPLFPLKKACDFICSKVNLPLFPEEKIENIWNEIDADEYQKGMILANLPFLYDSVAHVKRHLESKGMKVYLFFFEMDGETLSIALNKIDRWVHPATNRSYHLSFNPPQSFTQNNTLFDDETGDPLIQLPHDTYQGYQEGLTSYHLRAMNIFLHFYQDSYHIEGGSTFSDTQRAIMKTLYTLFTQVIAQQTPPTHFNNLSSISNG